MGKLQRVKKLMSSVKAKQGLLLVVILSFVLSLSLSLAPLPKVFRDVFYIGMNGVAYGIELDATCDGDNDDIQVQGILTDNVPAGGGEIVLLAGAYDFHVTVTRAINNVKISGSGKATSITTVGVTAPFTCTGQTGWTFEAFASDDAPAYTKTNGITASTVVNGIWVNSVFTVDFPSPETIVRTATAVVAANDATTAEKAQADYVCDGSADQTEINAAIDFVTSTGGIVQLTQGTFVTTGSVVVKESVWLRGSGMKLTSIRPSAIAADIVTGDGTDADTRWSVKVSDFYIDGTNQTAGSGLCIDRGWGTAQISNIQADYCHDYGIYGDNSDDGYLHDPVITNVVASHNGYDGIHLTQPYGVKLNTAYLHLNGASAVMIADGLVGANHVHVFVNPASTSVGFRVSCNVTVRETGGVGEVKTIDSFVTNGANDYSIVFTSNLASDNYHIASTAYVTQKGDGLYIGGDGSVSGGGETQLIGVNSDMNRGHGIELDDCYKGIVFGPSGYIGENLMDGIRIYGGYLINNMTIADCYIGENNNTSTRSNATGGSTENYTETGSTYGYSGLEIDSDEAGIVIHGNQIGDNSSGGYTQIYGIKIKQTDTIGVEIFGNTFLGNVTAAVLNNSTEASVKIHNNIGYVTEASGASSGTGAQQTIAHGLNRTPTRQQISLTAGTATANPYHSAAPDATNIYVTAVNGQAWYWATNGT